MLRLLVTGAGGFIGAGMVGAALQRGYEVTAAVRDEARCERLQNYRAERKFRLVSGFELTNPGEIERIVRDTSPDVVFHAAAVGSGVGHANQREMLMANVAGLSHLLESSPRGRVIILGSALEYGSGLHAHKESEPLLPEQSYGLIKMMCSELASFQNRCGGVDVINLRLFNVYGPGDMPPRLVPSCIHAALAGSPLHLTTGMQARDFVYIDDVLRVALAAADGVLPVGTYNVSTGVATGVAEVARTIVELVESRSRIELGAVSQRSDSHAILVGSPSRLARLGLAPRVSLRHGLAKTIERTSKRYRNS